MFLHEGPRLLGQRGQGDHRPGIPEANACIGSQSNLRIGDHVVVSYVASQSRLRPGRYRIRWIDFNDVIVGIGHIPWQVEECKLTPLVCRGRSEKGTGVIRRPFSPAAVELNPNAGNGLGHIGRVPRINMTREVVAVSDHGESYKANKQKERYTKRSYRSPSPGNNQTSCDAHCPFAC